MKFQANILHFRFLESPLQKICGYDLYIDLLSIREVTIGRSPENTIVIPDPTVSRKHAVILREESSIVLRDLSSKNGTYIMTPDNKIIKIREIRLERSLKVRFGLFTLTLINVLTV